MSDDDKKRDRALQRRVRERQAKTGESYQAAWRQLTDSADPPPPEELFSDEVTTSVPLPEPGTLASLLLPNEQDYPRLVLPLASLSQTPAIPRVLPRHPTRITARPINGAFDLTSLHISGAGTAGGAGDWIVNDIEVDGRSQLQQKDLPGTLFGGTGIAGVPRAMTAMSFTGFEPVEHDRELALIITYIGPNPEGVPFFASAVGLRPLQRPTVVPIASSEALPHLVKKTICLHVENAPFQVSRIEIEDGQDWIVDDVRISGKSQFVQAGGIPGDMFATDAIDSFMQLEPCPDRGMIELDVFYIGPAEQGVRFKGKLEGTVVREDHSTPPPDLRVVTKIDDKCVGDVIATCNWRPPPISNRTP